MAGRKLVATPRWNNNHVQLTRVLTLIWILSTMPVFQLMLKNFLTHLLVTWRSRFQCRTAKLECPSSWKERMSKRSLFKYWEKMCTLTSIQTYLSKLGSTSNTKSLTNSSILLHLTSPQEIQWLPTVSTAGNTAKLADGVAPEIALLTSTELQAVRHFELNISVTKRVSHWRTKIPFLSRI